MLLNLTSSCIMPIGRTAYQVNPVSSSSIPYPCTKLLNLSIESIVAQMVVFLISDILDYIIH